MVFEIKKEYSWKTLNFKVPASVVGAEMERIEKEHGEVTSRLLLEDARKEDSPIHNMLEWDDSVAAEKWRLKQCGNIIAELQVQIVRVPQEVKNVDVQIKKVDLEEERKTEQVNMKKSPDEYVAPIRAFVNIERKNHQRISMQEAKYVNVVSAMGDEEKRKQVLLNALDELHSFQRKYANYCEFASLFEDIKRIEIQINTETEERMVANG